MKESIVDIKRETLDSKVFDLSVEPALLLPIVRLQILKQVQEFQQYAQVERVLLIGSLLTKQWTETSDCDITLVVKQEDDEQYENAKKLSIQQEGLNLIEGTLHPINCFVRRDWDDSYSDQVYDILDNKWLKQTEVEQIDIENYMDSFSKYVEKIDLLKGELHRDIIDYNELTKYDVDSITGLHQRVQDKLEEIDDDVKKLVASYKMIHALRKVVFSNELTPEDLKTYKVRGAMPANVIYKLLSHYHYDKLLKALGMALSQAQGKIQTAKDIEKISKVIGMNNLIQGKITIENGIDLFKVVL